MKTRVLVMVLLLSVSSCASAAWFYTCIGSPSGSTVCSGANARWVSVGSYTPVGQSIFSSDAGCAVWGWQPSSFVGTIAYSYQCSVKPSDGGGFNCVAAGGVASCTAMTVLSPVSCIPSPRTIDPCPSGYAPSSVNGSSGTVGDSYSSAFEKLPIQDMLYGIGMAICGLLGLGVGTRLV